jgi:hypothetical protein
LCLVKRGTLHWCLNIAIYHILCFVFAVLSETIEDRTMLILQFESMSLAVGAEDDLGMFLRPMEAGGVLQGAITPFVTPPVGLRVSADRMVQFRHPAEEEPLPSASSVQQPGVSFAEVARASEVGPVHHIASEFSFYIT